MFKFIKFFGSFLYLFFVCHFAQASGGKGGSSSTQIEKEITSSFCHDFDLAEIPVGSFQPPLFFPLDPMRITQHYNTTKESGYCMVGGGQFDGDNSNCKGQTIYYGHDGLDLHPKSSSPGVNPVLSIQPGLIIASHASGKFKGWGESVVVVTRPNKYSEELLTFHYHHLHSKGQFGQENYFTTRLVNACEQVVSGQEIAKEGGTPGWPTHLHLSVKRWASLTILQSEISSHSGRFYGYGYTFGDHSKIKNFLDPESLLYGNFQEFQQDSKKFQDWQWAKPYADFMRAQGWEFGLYQGSFGLDQPVTRREAARYFKQAGQFVSFQPVKSHFQDLQLTDSDSVYVESLLIDQRPLPILSPSHSCISGQKMFCADAVLNKAEALKMTISAFYQEQFLSFQSVLIDPKNLNNLLGTFTDVSPSSWYAPFVAFAAKNGLITNGKQFYPQSPINRAELAFWLTTGFQFEHGVSGNPCGKISCPQGKYCDPNWKLCLTIPSCLPDENTICEHGGVQNLGGSGGSASNNAGSSPNTFGGNSGSNGQAGKSISNAGSTSQSGFGGAPSFSGSSGNTSFNGGQAGSSGSAGPTVGSGNNSGQAQAGSSTGQSGFSNGQAGSGNTTGTGNDGGQAGNANSAGTGNNGGQAGNSGQATAGQTGQSGATNSCQTVYYKSPQKASCNNNASSSGSPTLCLEVNQVNQSHWEFQVCKQGSSFGPDISYEILDQNNLSHYLGSYKSNLGQSCTPWQDLDFFYLSKNGPQNGAALQVIVKSPSSCTQSSCQYYPGLATVYLECLLPQLYFYFKPNSL